MLPQTIPGYVPDETRKQDNQMGAANSEAADEAPSIADANKHKADTKQEAEIGRTETDSVQVPPGQRLTGKKQHQNTSTATNTTTNPNSHANTAKGQSDFLNSSPLSDPTRRSSLDGSLPMQQQQQQQQQQPQQPQQQHKQQPSHFPNPSSQLGGQVDGHSAQAFGQTDDQHGRKFPSPSSTVGGQLMSAKAAEQFAASSPTNGQLSSTSAQFNPHGHSLMDSSSSGAFRAPTSGACSLSIYNFTTQSSSQPEEVVTKKKFKPSPKRAAAPKNNSSAPHEVKQASTAALAPTSQSSFSSSDSQNQQQIQLQKQQMRDNNFSTVANTLKESTTTTSVFGADSAFSLPKRDLPTGQHLGSQRLEDPQQRQQFLPNLQHNNQFSLSGDTSGQLGQVDSVSLLGNQVADSSGASSKGAKQSPSKREQPKRPRRPRKSSSESTKKKTNASSTSLTVKTSETPKSTPPCPANEAETPLGSRIVDDYFSNLNTKLMSNQKPLTSQANSASSTTVTTRATTATTKAILATPPTPTTPATASPTSTPTTAAPETSRAPKGSLSRLFTSSSVDNNDIARAFEELRDNTWNNLSKYVLEQAQQFDIPPLIGLLYTLRTENEKLENRVRDLTKKRDQLLVVNARLDLPGPLLMQHLNSTSPNFASVVSCLTNSPKSLLSPCSYYQAMPMAHSQPGSPYYNRK